MAEGSEALVVRVTDDRPLHVRVAEALGWTDLHAGIYFSEAFGSGGTGDWTGTAPGPPKPFDNGWVKGEVVSEAVPRYDTDWSATGPLIERYFIGLKYQERKWWAGRKGHPHSVWYSSETPLFAACHLILALSAAGKLPK